MKTAGNEYAQVVYLYLLILRSQLCDTLFLFYARDEQHAQRQAIACQREQEDMSHTSLQRVEFRRCPQGFTTGSQSFWPPTRQVRPPFGKKEEQS